MDITFSGIIFIISLTYLYLYIKIRRERKFSEKAIYTNEVRRLIDLGFTGYVICVSEYHLLNCTYMMKKVYYFLSKERKVIIYKLPKDEMAIDFDITVIQDLKLKTTPSICYISNGKTAEKQLLIQFIKGKNEMKSIIAGIHLLNRELAI